MGDNRFDEYLLATSKEIGEDLASGGGITSVRVLGMASIVCAVVWAWGLGSLFAIGLGAIAFLLRGRAIVVPLPGLRLAAAGIVLGVAGMVVAVALYA